MTYETHVTLGVTYMTLGVTYVTHVTVTYVYEQAILTGTNFPFAFIFYTLADVAPPGTISFQTPFFASKT